MTVGDFDELRQDLPNRKRARLSDNCRRLVLSAGLGLTFLASVGIPIAAANPDGADSATSDSAASDSTTSSSSDSAGPSSPTNSKGGSEADNADDGDDDPAPISTDSDTAEAAEEPAADTTAATGTRTTGRDGRMLGMPIRVSATTSRDSDRVRAAQPTDDDDAEQLTRGRTTAAPKPTEPDEISAKPVVIQQNNDQKSTTMAAAPEVAAAAAAPATPSLASFLNAIFDTIRRELTKFWVNLQRFFSPRNSEQVEEPVEPEPGVIDDPLPTVTDDAFAGAANTTIAGNVLTNDLAPQGSPISALLASSPSSGTVTLNADGSFIYVPAADFTGTDVFSYRAYAGSLASQLMASVTITVTAAASPENPPLELPTVGIQGLSWWVGLTREQIDDALTKAKAANVTSVRMDFSWSVIEWSEGTYDWSSTDSMVEAVAAHGMTALAMVYDTPTWLSGSTDPHAVPVNAAQIQQFAEFAAAAAQRYGAVIPEWEVWNEQNIPRFWAVPDAAAYTALLKATYTAIKAVDPDAVVIAGGLSPDPSGISTLDFVEGIYAAGGKGYFDALNYHHYAFPNIPTVDPLAAIHAVMVANGDGHKKIWITEAGAPTGTGSYAVTEQVQADTIVAILTQAAENSYIGPVYLYTITDTGTDLSDPESNFGLITQDGRLKPAYQALLDFMTQRGSSAPAVSA